MLADVVEAIREADIPNWGDGTLDRTACRIADPLLPLP
jgi:hypothetical protein